MKKPFTKVIKTIAATSLVLSILGAPITALTVHAEESVYGIPIRLYDQLTIAKSRLLATVDGFKDYQGSEAYKLKFKADLLFYRYAILTAISKSGAASSETITQHIETFNYRASKNLDDSMQIDAKTISSKVGEELPKTVTEALKIGDQLNSKLDKINKDASAPDTNSVAKMLAANAKDITIYFQTFKQFFDDYDSVADASTLATYKSSFAGIYNNVIGLSAKLNIDEISKMDILNTIQDKPFLNTIEDIYDSNTNTFTSPMLSLIALSSTFRPMHTNVNDGSTYDILGETEKAFHKLYGKKRKFLWTPTKETNNINEGVNKKSSKTLRVVLLKDVLSETEDTKILYLDNQQYLDSDGLPQEVQDDLKPVTTKASEEIQKATDKVKEATDNLKDSAEKIPDKVADSVEKGVTNAVDSLTGAKYVNQLNEKIQKFVGTKIQDILGTATGKNPLPEANSKIKDLVFASADLTKAGNTMNETSHEMINSINISHMTLKNIIAQYKGVYTSIKLYRDMNRPVYMDIYGNILSSSGIVILPAVDNPIIYKKESPNYLFNLAFIESYPKFNLVNGSLRAAKGEEGKWSIVKDYQNNIYISDAFGYSQFNDSTKLGKTLDQVSIIDETKSIKNVSTMWDLKNNVYLGKVGLNPITLVLDSKGDKKKVTIREVPNNESILRVIYISNLQNIARVEKDTFVDNGILNSQWMFENIVKEIYDHGITGVDAISNLMPDMEKTQYDKYLSLVTDLSENKFTSFLQNNQGNNIVYSKPINEIDVLYPIIPITYAIILLVAIITSFIYIVLATIMPEGRLIQVLKILGIVTLVTFLLTGVNSFMDWSVNYPIKKIYQNQLSLWTLVDQERDTHQKELEADGSVGESGNDGGIGFRLYKLPYDYPYKLAFSAIPSDQPVDDFYDGYLNNNDKYRYQHNIMKVKGDYLTSTTKQLFDSSSIDVDSGADLGKKMKHNIYAAPELAYYLPYYTILDNLVYNLNQITTFNNKMPYVIPYADGVEKTSGRVHYWLNSQIFIDNKLFEDSYKQYTSNTSGEDTEQHNEELTNVDNFLRLYGDPTDFLGLKKILDVDLVQSLKREEAIAPLTDDGVSALKQTLWYPKEFSKKISDKEKLELIREVNDDTKRFALGLSDLSDKVADEHLLKTIALYAALDFNKKFSNYNGGNVPTDLEMDQVPLDRFTMSMIMPKEDLVKNSINSYYNYLSQKSGYIGVTLGSLNDLFMIIINYVKPIIVVAVWALTAAIIYLRKIVIPDPRNRSIYGVLKINLLYCGSSLSFVLFSYFIILSTNLKANPAVYLFFSTILSIFYVVILCYIIYALLKDTINLGSSVTLKSLDQLMDTATRTLSGFAQSIPFVGRRASESLDNALRNSNVFNDYLAQESLRRADNIGNHNPKVLLDVAKTGYNKVTELAQIREQRIREALSRGKDKSTYESQKELRDTEDIK